MNLSQLYYFRKLAELEHYTRASKELYITQPALSEAIHSLEEELGVPLFQREGRNVRLTKYGREFQGYVNASLQELDKGIAVMKSYTGAIEGKVKIGATYSVQGDYLPAVLQGFRREVSKEVQFETYQAFSAKLVEGVRAGEYDVAFACPMEEAADLAAEPVVAHPLVMCCAPGFCLADRSSLRLEELRGHRVFTYRRGTAIGERVNDQLTAHGVTAEQSFEDEITLGGTALANEDACSLAIKTIGLRSFSDDLRIVPIQDVPEHFHVLSMVYRKHEFQSLALERFLDYVRTCRHAPNSIVE